MKKHHQHHLRTVIDCCPWCGRGPLTGATNAVAGEKMAPKPGDLSICIYCTKALQFTKAGVARLTAAEIVALPTAYRDQLRYLMGIARSNRGDNPVDNGD